MYRYINILGKIYRDLDSSNMNMYKYVREVDEPITDEEKGIFPTEDNEEVSDLDELRDLL